VSRLNNLEIGDIVVRKSYVEDAYFRIANIINKGDAKPVYVLRGLLFRLEADSTGEDLVKKDARTAYNNVRSNILIAKRQTVSRGLPDRFSFLNFWRGRAGRILHVDSSEEFMNTCLNQYAQARINATGKLLAESEQPNHIRKLLEKNKPDILVVTGHDSMKKNIGNSSSLSSYSNSKYYIQSVQEARSYEPDKDKLCIFAGACQSYFEAIMDAGANFASSPGRVLINALDPAIVSEKVSLTDSRSIVPPQEVAKLTVSGSAGIGGIKTKGRMLR
jgi:spore coat assemly protein